MSAQSLSADPAPRRRNPIQRRRTKLPTLHKRKRGTLLCKSVWRRGAVAGIIADSSYARLDEMVRLIITQILDQQTAGWQGPARAARTLIPWLTRLTLLGGQLLFHARYHHRLVARPDLAIGDHRIKQTLRATGTTPPPILLIHAQDDPMVALHQARRLVAAARAAGRSIREYYTSCAIHCGSYEHDPHRYMALILEFVPLG